METCKVLACWSASNALAMPYFLDSRHGRCASMLAFCCGVLSMTYWCALSLAQTGWPETFDSCGAAARALSLIVSSACCWHSTASFGLYEASSMLFTVYFRIEMGLLFLAATRACFSSSAFRLLKTWPIELEM